MSEAATMTLTDFLLARLAEDEAWAQLAQAGSDQAPWQQGIGPLKGDVFSYAGLRIAETRGINVARFISMHDPARVLADVAAKRAIVEAYDEEGVRAGIYNRDYPLGLLTTDEDLRSRLASNARWAGLEIAVRALAQPYADHPDFREEWRT